MCRDHCQLGSSAVCATIAHCVSNFNQHTLLDQQQQRLGVYSTLCAHQQTTLCVAGISVRKWHKPTHCTHHSCRHRYTSSANITENQLFCCSSNLKPPVRAHCSTHTENFNRTNGGFNGRRFSLWNA